ncbi:MAG: hypothetical protein SGJ21_08980 [Alphaproteobacteria bacterium]|nr:hypothetical protein [Alphaproteobacteria bacterium]
MLGQVKKLIEPVAGNDVAGRFGAWWNGREYVAPQAETIEEAGATSVDAVVAIAAVAPQIDSSPPAPAPMRRILDGAAAGRPASIATVDGRLRALATLWGAQRFAPGSPSLDARILDTVFEGARKPGELGFIGADGALLNACRARTERVIRAVEWRGGCVDVLRELASGVDVQGGDVDRPRGFADGRLEGLVSIEAFAYADHKAGLVARAYKALSETGLWVFLDTTRRTSKTPAEAFASAWAEPLLSTAEEIGELLRVAGFRSVRREAVTPLVLEAARLGYARLGGELEKASSAALDRRDGAMFLQELAWEAQSWRARMRAMEGGALSVDLWIASKGEAAELAGVGAGVPGRPADDAAAATLFD